MGEDWLRSETPALEWQHGVTSATALLPAADALMVAASQHTVMKET